MEEFVIKWGAAVGIYLITGTLMQALNTTIGAKAGDPGWRGIWFVWRRWFIVLLGIGLGAAAPALGLSSPLGDGYGYSILDGLIAAWAASGTYDATLKTVKVRAQHLVAKRSDDPK